MKRSISQAFARRRAIINREIEARHQELQNLTEEYIQRCNHLAKAIQELLEQRNDLAPVSRLPPELLSYIFLLDAGPFDEDGFQSCESPLGWLHALWVCRYWRRVALATCQLWVQVPLMHVGYVEAALNRSGGLPLTIYSLSDSDPAQDPLGIYQVLQRDIHRIHAIDLAVTDQALPYLRALQLNTSYLCATILEKLRLRCSTWGFARDSESAAVGILSSLKIPRLRSLTIIHSSPSLVHSLARPTVTDLDISFASYFPVEPRSLLDLLEGMPLLQRLNLRGLHNTVLEEFLPVDTRRTILLSRLTYVHLEGSNGLDMAYLLQHLSFSDKTSVRFQAIGVQGNDETYEVVLPLVISRTTVAGRTPKRNSSTQPRLRAMMLDATNFRLRLWRSSLNALDLDDNTLIQEPPRLEFSCYGDCSVLHPMSTLSFLPSLDLSALSILHFKPHIMSDRYWVGVFRGITLPKLEEISFSDSGGGCPGLFRALGTPLPVSTTSTESVHSEGEIMPKERHHFPALKTLKLDDIYDGHVTEVLRDLSKLLRHRARAGMKLTTLEINIPWHLDPGGLVNATIRDVRMYTLAQSVKITDASGVLKG